LQNDVPLFDIFHCAQGQEFCMATNSKDSLVIAIVGGGTMGADIAASFVACGWIAQVVNPIDQMRVSLPARLQAAMVKLLAPYDAAAFPLHTELDTVPWKAVDWS
jgi:hypothetical protein